MKLNGAYILMGLLYGQGDPDKTITIACRCGQDSDCNPSNAGGILFAILGAAKIPPRFTEKLDLRQKFSPLGIHVAEGVQGVGAAGPAGRSPRRRTDRDKRRRRGILRDSPADAEALAAGKILRPGSHRRQPVYGGGEGKNQKVIGRRNAIGSRTNNVRLVERPATAVAGGSCGIYLPAGRCRLAFHP